MGYGQPGPYSNAMFTAGRTQPFGERTRELVRGDARVVAIEPSGRYRYSFTVHPPIVSPIVGGQAQLESTATITTTTNQGRLSAPHDTSGARVRGAGP
jgi:hypothetical protein